VGEWVGMRACVRMGVCKHSVCAFNSVQNVNLVFVALLVNVEKE
jgi:hypothetical protein